MDQLQDNNWTFPNSDVHSRRFVIASILAILHADRNKLKTRDWHPEDQIGDRQTISERKLIRIQTDLSPWVFGRSIQEIQEIRLTRSVWFSAWFTPISSKTSTTLRARWVANSQYLQCTAARRFEGVGSGLVWQQRWVKIACVARSVHTPFRYHD